MPCPFTGPKMFWAGPNFLVPDQADPAQFGWKSQSFSIYLHTALIAGSILCRNENARRIKSCKNSCQKNGQSYNWCWKVVGGWDYCTPGTQDLIL